MSRSALTRHATQKSAVFRGQIVPPPETLCDPQEEYCRKIKQDELIIHGNSNTYNLNTLLYQNILHSEYFRQLYNLKTYHEVVDEIYYRVDHAEPLCPGTSRIPSTCFCLLLKCFTMRLTTRQMQGLLKHTDSPYIRAIGFLYLRYTCDPEKLYDWYEPYLDDEEEFNASANANIQTSIGAYLSKLLQENNYFGTIFPRIPKKIQDRIKVKLLLHARKKDREKENASLLPYLQPGMKIRAMYADEENEPAMYDAVIDSMNEKKTEFHVTFPEYGNSETVGLGDMDLTLVDLPYRGSSPRRARKHRRSRSSSRSNGRTPYRARSRSDSRSRRRKRRRTPSLERSTVLSLTRNRSEPATLTQDLLEQVREQERRKAEAVGRDYAARPASYKGSLSMKLDRFTTRKRSPTAKNRLGKNTEPEPVVVSTLASKEIGDAPKHKEAEQRLEMLRKRYGDASANCIESEF